MKLVPVLIILGLAALVGGGFWVTVLNQSVCPGHWHAEQQVYIDGHHVTFVNPHFYLEGPSQGVPNTMPVSSHMHQGNPDEWHFEPNPSTCIKLGNAERFIGMSVDSSKLELSGAHSDIPLEGAEHNQAGTYAVAGNKTLTAYSQVPDGQWTTESVGHLMGRQLKDGEKVLILYGTYTDAQVRALKSAEPAPEAFVQGYRATHGGQNPVYPQ